MQQMYRAELGCPPFPKNYPKNRAKHRNLKIETYKSKSNIEIISLSKFNFWSKSNVKIECFVKVEISVKNQTYAKFQIVKSPLVFDISLIWTP